MTDTFDVQLFDNSSGAMPDGGMIRTRTSIDDRLAASLPSDFDWSISFEYNRPDKSTITCTADVRDESGVVVSTPVLKSRLIAGSPGGDALVPLPTFRVTVTGTYVVRLYVDEVCVWARSVLVSDSM